MIFVLFCNYIISKMSKILVYHYILTECFLVNLGYLVPSKAYGLHGTCEVQIIALHLAEHIIVQGDRVELRQIPKGPLPQLLYPVVVQQDVHDVASRDAEGLVRYFFQLISVRHKVFQVSVALEVLQYIFGPGT